MSVERQGPVFKIVPAESGFIPSSTRTNVEDFASLDKFDTVPDELREIAVDIAASVIDASEAEVNARFVSLGKRSLTDEFTMSCMVVKLEFVYRLHEGLRDPKKESSRPNIQKALKIELASLEASSMFAKVLGYNPQTHNYGKFIHNPDYQSAQMLIRGAVGNLLDPKPTPTKSTPRRP